MNAPEDREFRLAFCKLHILYHAAKGPVYGLWVLQELAEHGHRLSPGTLYPMLARMERNGWLRSVSGGGPKDRRDYQITPAGRCLLQQLSCEVGELHDELNLGVEPQHGTAPDEPEGDEKP